jgi:Na+/H+ antiporter NhaD/arsenite permease-like protein
MLLFLESAELAFETVIAKSDFELNKAIKTFATNVNSALSIFGADLEPNLTTIGSLATVLWLVILRRKGLEVSSAQYFKIGVLVIPIMLLLGALAIWLSVLLF